MSKIVEAAKLVAQRKQLWDDRAQAIIDGMPALESKANEAFEKPEALITATEQEFKDMHVAFDEARALSNSENGEGDKEATSSEGSSISFQQIGGERG